MADLEKHFTNPADKFHVDAASGWIGLGDLDSARAELAQVSPEIRNHPAVLMVQSELQFAEKNWELLLPLTETLLGQFPNLEFLWINRSFALHELKRTREAFDALLPAAQKFPQRWLIHYNLACYCSQLGAFAEAIRWLQKAIGLAGKTEIKSLALDDPDLQPLWQQIREF